MPLIRRRFLPLVAFALVAGSIACNTATETYPIGQLAARVLNESNVGVQGVLLDLYKIEVDGPIRWRATITSSNGIGVFGARDGGVIEGDYYIHVSFTTNHELAAGETNDRPVIVMEGDDIVVTFRVVPKAIGL